MNFASNFPFKSKALHGKGIGIQYSVQWALLYYFVGIIARYYAILNIASLLFCLSLLRWCILIAAHLPRRKSCSDISSAIHLTYTTIYLCCMSDAMFYPGFQTFSRSQNIPYFKCAGCYWSAEKQSCIRYLGLHFISFERYSRFAFKTLKYMRYPGLCWNSRCVFSSLNESVC